MNKLPSTLACLLLFLAGCDGAQTQPVPSEKITATAEHAAEHASHDVHGPSNLRVEDLPEGLNPVQVEMRLLEDAMKHSLTIIANGDLQQLPPTIFAVHGARAETERAIQEGRYRPPANAEDLEGFSSTDAAFHDGLVRMVKAAKAGDRAGAARAYGQVVNGCANCHATYRPGFQ